jgi:GR25 family glycosyltransferase involved in LPS biosynthesis
MIIAMETIDAILYINLEHREDRAKSILDELKRFDVPSEKIHRVAGVYNKECGHIGCGQAHINALTLVKQKGWGRVMILEDDFYFKIELGDLNNFINNSDKLKWDVLLLSSGHITTVEMDDSIKRAVSCTTTAGYIVKQEYCQTLLDNFNRSFLKMNIQLQQHIERYNGKPVPKLIHGVYAIDMAWKELQAKDTFLISCPVAGAQGRYSSDTF